MSRQRTRRAFPEVPDIPDIRAILRGPRLSGALCIGRGRLFDDTIHRESPEARAARHDAARRICSRCPAAPECSEVARGLPAEHRRGVWAGHVYDDPAPQRKGAA